MIKKVLTVFGFVLIVSAVSGYAQLTNKLYDPLESLNKNVPPNIMITVDNSGSMKDDQNGRFIYGYFGNIQNGTTDVDPGISATYYYGSPSVGDFWHFNLEDTTFYEDTSPGSGWDGQYYIPRDNGSWDLDISYPAAVAVPCSREFTRTSDENVDFVAIGINVWVRDGRQSDFSYLSVNMVHEFSDKDGNPATIVQSVPTTLPVHWYKTGAYYTDIYGNKYYEYRVKYAFKDFYSYSYIAGSDTITMKVPQSGSWTVNINGASSYIRVNHIGVSFKPLLSKIAIMKTVLERLFETVDLARFALGTYGHKYIPIEKLFSYPLYHMVFDNDGKDVNTAGNAYAYQVKDDGFDLSILEPWPSNDLGIWDNRSALADWVNMDEVGLLGNFEQSSKLEEICAYGGTPIEEALEGVRTLMSNTQSSDPYEACRNYVSILLTDGLCTSGGCNVEQTILDTYSDHSVNGVGTQTFVIGFAMDDTTILDAWADAGNDGLVGSQDGNEVVTAFSPSNSEELMSALKQAIYAGLDKEVVLDSDVVFGTVDPSKASQYNDLFNDRTVYIVYENQAAKDAGDDPIAKNEKDADDIEVKRISSYYPSVVSNILYSTRAYYSSWNGSLMAYQPIYKVVTVSETDNITELKYFDNGSYPVVWDSKVELDKRLKGEGVSTSHVNGIRDALGMNKDYPATANDSPAFRNIYLIDSSRTSYINLGEYTWNEGRHRWVSDNISTVAGLIGESETYAENFIDFLQTRQIADITNSTPSFCGEPEMGFDEWNDDYFYYKINKRLNRIPIVMVGANDGMLHAFNAYDGEEIWTVVPYGVIPQIKKMVNNYDQLDNPSGQIPMTDLDYLGRSGHIYGVASSPKVVDVFNLAYTLDVSTENWMTYMVCGLGGGGNSYFALDITDTYNPIPKWEVEHPGFGETWTHPAMWRGIAQGQNQNDTFYANVGFFTSGYSSDASKGKTLYVLNILDGTIFDSQTYRSSGFFISAPAGILNTELSEIQGVYFGDSLGNMYRYDLKEYDLCKTYQTNEETPIMANPSVHKGVDRVEWVSYGELGQEDRANSLFAAGSTLYTYKVPECSANKSLVNLTSEISSSSMFNQSFPLEGKDGFYFTLQDNEILLTDPLNTTFYYEVNDGAESHWEYETVSIFVTYKYPDLATDACGDGTSYMYIFGISDLFVGDSENDGEMASEIGEGRSGNPVKTGVTNSVWINSKTGPVRILPLDSDVSSQSVELFFYFSGKDSRKIGAGSWFVR